MADNLRFIRPLSFAIGLVLVAGAGKWALSRTGIQTLPSASLPTAEELDSLRHYVVRSKPRPLPVPVVQMASAGPVYNSGNENRWADPAFAADPSVRASQRPAVAAKPRWVVSTIMITDTRRVAVLNGALVTPGQTLANGARVISIESDRVVLAEANGARRELPVRGGGE